MKTFSIFRLTILEARRRKLLWVILIMGLCFLALFGVGVFFMHRDMARMNSPTSSALLEPTNFFFLAGMYVINCLTVMLAVLVSVDTIAGEIASGTAQTIVTKPLRRWEVVLGKWLGLAVMLSVFVVLMSIGLLIIIRVIADYTPPHPWQGIPLIVVGGLVTLTLSILGGTRLSTLTNGVVVFMLYGLAFIAGWIEQIGSFLRNAAAVDIGIVVSLLMPTEAMWKRAAYLMQPPFLRELGLSVTPFGAASAPSEAMVIYAVVYILVMLALAMRSFQTRDL